MWLAGGVGGDGLSDAACVRVTAQIESTTKFLKNDGKVLRFYCTWDDNNIFGEKRPYVRPPSASP